MTFYELIGPRRFRTVLPCQILLGFNLISPRSSTLYNKEGQQFCIADAPGSTDLAYANTNQRIWDFDEYRHCLFSRG